MSNWYTGGALTVLTGETDFSLATGALLSQAAVGDLLIRGTFFAIIESITDNTNGVLVTAWQGSSASGEPDYQILHTGADWQTNVTINQQLADIITTLEAGQGLKPDATGTLAERDQYDDETQGFIFVRTDVVPFAIYIKATDASADWAGPSTFGQGATGAAGATGGDRYDVFVWDNALPMAGDALLKAKFTTTVVFPAGLSESRAGADIAASASTVFSLRKNDVQFGTVTYSTGGIIGVFAASLSTSFVSGDVLTVVAPDPYDATLLGVFMTVTGSR